MTLRTDDERIASWVAFMDWRETVAEMRAAQRAYAYYKRQGNHIEAEWQRKVYWHCRLSLKSKVNS